MIRSFSIALLLLLALTSAAQNKKDIVVTIGDLQINKQEFEANYKKNNTSTLEEKDKKTPAEYLELYINFKLKVLEAEKLGYDTIKSFVDELKGYRDELSKPYLTNVSFNEEMVKAAYYRTQYERQASHILIKVAPDATPADTLAAWNKISDIRKQIIEGADFGEMAAKNSEDPSAVQNKGMLGYFGAFRMVYPFENMTYNTAVGQVSNIARTRFGYHIIKVHDERKNEGEIKVAHIMKLFPQNPSIETVAKMKLSADSIWLKATSGEDFAELAKKYSDDKNTSDAGGVMNWFSLSKFPVTSFADAAFALKKDGDISPVTRTDYGWHIIKRIELRPTPSLDEMRPDLEAKIKDNPQISQYSDEAFYHILRNEYQVKTNDQNLAKLATLLTDTAKVNLETKANLLKNTQIFSFANQIYTCGNFVQYLDVQKYVPQKTNPEQALKSELEKYINKKLIEYENTQLEKKHPDFANIYREYHDGILLFNISKDKIWDTASSDTVRLQNYFDRTSKKYYWDERFKGMTLQTKDAETRSKLETMLDTRELTKQEIIDLFNTKTENNVQITEVAVEKGKDPVVDYYIWNGPKPEGFDETTTFVHGKKVLNELKELKDAWGLYSSDFQEQIEKDWINALRQKYPITINKKVLKKIPMIG
jgi:peptidyl-prolyl cis-trans isomerase SurA